MAETNGQQEQRKSRNRLALALVVIGMIIILLAGGLYISSASPTASALLQSSITPSPEVESGEALKSLRATEDFKLNNYSWADRDNGIVRIPIDRAMDLVLQRGLPVRPTPTPQP